MGDKRSVELQMSLLLKAMWRREGCISFKSIISASLAIDISLYSSLEDAGKDRRAPAYIKASSQTSPDVGVYT